LTHCTPSRDWRSYSRRARRATIAAILLVAAAAWSTPAALADGDPASDVLAQQSLFLPQDTGIPPAQQTQLTALIQAAARRGYPIRVALIASTADLGSVTALWRQPDSYARFLGQELSLVYHGRLLVIMPSGLGLYYYAGHPGSAERSALTSLPPPGPRTTLATVALTAIKQLAAASGHPVSIPNTATPANHGPSNATPWIVFGVGLVLIALAWAASLRAKPPRPPWQRAASS
jgi:hypothetical protein